MNDFERIYTVIKSQYSCGVPYYNYDACTYDQLSNMYYQQGTLNLPSSTGYSNVPFNDIPVACGFPNVVYRQCVPSDPPDDEEEKKDELPQIPQTSGFRINVNSAYVYPENNTLILKNPVDFNMNYLTTDGVENIKNALYLLEKKGYSNCIKHIISGKYIGIDNSNNFILVDNCTDNNSFIYDSDKLLLKYQGNCVNPNTFYNIVPNNTPLRISPCNENIDVILEKLSDQIASYVNLKEIPISYIQSASTTIIPSTYARISKYNIPSKYSTSQVISSKVRYSEKSIFVIIKTSASSRAFLSFDEGITWIQLTSSTRILDGDMSADGKYITLSESVNINSVSYYVSQNAETPSINFKRNVITDFFYIRDYNVILSKTGQLQCLQFRNVNLINNNYGSGTFRNIGIGLSSSYLYQLCSSYSGAITISFTYQRNPFLLSASFLDNIILMIPSATIKANENFWIEDNIPPNSINNIQKILISEDCKYVFILDSNGLVINTNYLRPLFWKVNNIDNIKESQRVLLGTNTIDTTNVQGDMCISKNGKFVFLIYKVLKQDGTYGGLIFYSSDFGDTFKQLKTNNTFVNNNLTNFTSIDVSPDGKTLVLSDTNKVYKTTLFGDEIADDISEKNTVISLPENEFKYLFQISGLPSFSRTLKNGNSIFRISEQNIYEDNSTTILLTIPINIPSENITSICKVNDIILYTAGNQIYNRLSTPVFTASTNIVFVTFKIIGSSSMYIALSDKIHYSQNGTIWNTVNMISKKWETACIVPLLKNNNFVIYCVEEYGKFYFSEDNGLTWKSNDILDNYAWTSIDCSNDGKIVITTVKDNVPLISYDSGLSFMFINFSINQKDVSGNYIIQFADCSINDNGDVILAVMNTGRIIISNNYGKTWNYYGDYYFYQNDISLNKENILYSFGSSFRNTFVSGFTYTDSPLRNAFDKTNFFSYKPNLTSYPVTYNTTIWPSIDYIGNGITNINTENIKSDYIEIKFSYFMRLTSFYLGQGVYSSKTFFSYINEINLVGSNDGVIYERINILYPYETWYSSISKFMISTNTYYKNYRILLNKINRNVLTKSVIFNNIILEGDVYTPTTSQNITSNWNNITVKSNNILATKNNNQLLEGFKIHPIFTEDNLNRVVSDVTYTTGSQVLSSDLYVNNLTINTGYTLITNGFRIFCRGKLTNNGTITNSGEFGSSTSSSAIGRGGEGGARGTSSMTASSGSNTINTVVKADGGRGGSRSNNAVSGGNGGITTLDINTEILYNPEKAIIAQDASNNLIGGGAGGGGGASGSVSGNSGGTGGRGGGIIMICANEIENNGTITVSGQNGFNATPSSFIPVTRTQYGACGGGGGGGGTIIIVTKYTSKLSNTGFVVSGGKGGKGQTNNSITITTDSSNRSLEGTSGQNGMDGRLVVVFV
jgi:hypothetical protein